MLPCRRANSRRPHIVIVSPSLISVTTMIICTMLQSRSEAVNTTKQSMMDAWLMRKTNLNGLYNNYGWTLMPMQTQLIQADNSMPHLHTGWRVCCKADDASRIDIHVHTCMCNITIEIFVQGWTFVCTHISHIALGTTASTGFMLRSATYMLMT